MKRVGGLWPRAHFFLLLTLMLTFPFAGAMAQSELAGIALPPGACADSPGQAPEMVLIPPGTFAMGSSERSDEQPVHQVTVVRAFALMRCEVTVGQFRAFVAETGYRTDAERGKGCNTLKGGNDFGYVADAYWDRPGFEQGDDHPVVCVTWNDARAYAAWLGVRTGQAYRLPTEAEWAYAARGGSIRSRWWGDDPDSACDYANGADLSALERFPGAIVHQCSDGHVFTAPVGRYRANDFGLADMLGNALEWTADCWHDSYSGAPVDASAWLDAGDGDCTRRVLRGGGWYLLPEDLRSANRLGLARGAAFGRVGFRLARTP
ncbi:MAG: formylglycine-generating enzyme family protein [Gammaproteobacteria bacterium]